MKKKSSKSEFKIGLRSNKEECNILAGQNLLEFDATIFRRQFIERNVVLECGLFYLPFRQKSGASFFGGKNPANLSRSNEMHKILWAIIRTLGSELKKKVMLWPINFVVNCRCCKKGQ